MTAPADNSGRIVVGKITGLYGIKGWVKVQSYTTPPENLFAYQPWYLADPLKQTEKPAKPLQVRPHGKGYVAHLEGLDDRDSASACCSHLITVDSKALPDLPQGEYYWQQLIGLRVLSVYGKTPDKPVLLGQITGLMETGANDVIIVGPCESSLDQRERLLPYVESFILEVYMAAGTMLVDWDPEF